MNLSTSRAVGRRCMAAVVLGAALSALPAQAASTSADSERVVQEISRYCTVCWRNARLPADSWNDCTQEVLHRLLQNVSRTDWPQLLKGEGAPRTEFLRAIDAVKKRTQRGLKRSVALVESPADRRDVREQELRDKRETVQHAARTVLSTRQQQILQMSMEGWHVQDIAATMQLTPERISDDKYKAIRKLRTHLHGI